MSEVETKETSAVNRNLRDLNVPTWFSMLAISATVRTAVLQPLNIALARQRTQTGTVTPTRTILGEMFSNGGVRNIYRGFGAMLAGNIIGEVVYLGVLEEVKYALERNGVTQAQRDAAGGVSGDLAAFALCTPLGVVATRQMTAGFGMAEGNKYQSASAVARGMWNNGTSATVVHRVGNLYPGALASLMMVPASGVWWALYGQTKNVYYSALEKLDVLHDEKTVAHKALDSSPHPGAAFQVLLSSNWFMSSKDNPLVNGAAGITASALTALLYNPVTVVRTRLMVETSSDHAVTALWKRGRDLVANEGVRGFYKGARVNVVASVLEGLLFSTAYELTKLSSDITLLESVA